MLFRSTDLTVKAGANSSGKTVVIAGDAIIDGEVRGDLVVIGGVVRLGPKASVQGRLIVVAGGLEADADSTIRGKQVVIGLNSLFGKTPLARNWFRQGLMLA